VAFQESVEWEHKSKVPGMMHGCGYDAHVAMLLGSAKILQEHRDELQVGKAVLLPSYKKGSPVHVAPACTESGKGPNTLGLIYAAFPCISARLFLGLEPMKEYKYRTGH
jgi:hypothetical protein